jgi:hypothetical protein
LGRTALGGSVVVTEYKPFVHRSSARSLELRPD